MSILRPILNACLRATEKPYLSRVEDPFAIRASFETNARLFFHAPRGPAMTRTEVCGRDALRIAPSGPATGAATVLYFHGGCFLFGSPDTHKAMIARLALEAGLPAVLPRYPLAPEHPFPAALDHGLAVFRHLAAEGPVILGGDSAGGGLALSVLAGVLQEGLPRPLGLFAFSPLTDLTFSGQSLIRNARADVLLPPARTPEIAAYYLNGADPSDPRASPLFARYSGAPPIWLTVGDTEILLDDTRRMAAALRAQGVGVHEEIARDLPHVWPLFQTFLPEARATLKSVAAWIRTLQPPKGDTSR